MPLSETLLVYMALLTVGILVAALFRRLPIPYTVLLVLIGVSLGAVAQLWPVLEPLHQFRLTPELVLFVFLPTLIFEAGFNLNSRQLVKDIGPVLALAVPALLFSTAAVGLGLWLLLPIEPITALLFGALISATDPVAVIALFKELGAPLRLTVLVEGESLLNDATAIVVFNILLGLALYGEMQWSDAGLAVGEFLTVFLGGALVGIAFGLTVSWLMARAVRETAMVLILSLVTAYSCFIVAEHGLHLSGVMAVAAAAVTLGVFGIPRLPQPVGTALIETWEFLALICNTLLFLLVGLSVDLVNLISRLDTILLAVLVVLAARASTIYTLVPYTTRLFGLPRVTMGERHIMWWGGLKGGLAIAIVLSIPPELPGRQLLLDLTLGIVLFTLLVNAPTIRPLIRKLGIDRLTDVERAELKRGAELARESAQGILVRFRHAGILSRASFRQASKTLSKALADDGATVDEAQRLSREWSDVLRAELTALEELYQTGVIPQYTFLDLKGELQRRREQVVTGEGLSATADDHQPNPFLRLENNLIHWLREKDWAALMLAHYQNIRMSQHLFKDIAHILMTEAAQDYLHRASDGIDLAHRERLEGYYRTRMHSFRIALEEVQVDFPDLYRRFETRLSLRAALAQAGRQVEEESRHGSIGAKPGTLMQRQIQQKLRRVPSISMSLPDPQPCDLVALVPLFEGLPAASLIEVADRSKPVRFLTGDTIIGEDEHGDALYIVARGRVTVTRHTARGEECVVSERGVGDFFGETALLGDQVRTATVRAGQSCTLLRLTRWDVLAISEEHQAVAQRLQEARAARVKGDAERGMKVS
jgi:CPA1 family monovalent cation:H+ antiporter